MGDRASIVVKSGEERVCLYTHWSGSDLPNTLQNALARGESRWGDFQYLSRIIFCEMVGANWADLTGYGISQQVHDGGSRVIMVDVDAQTVQIQDNPPVPFAEYAINGSCW
jgi:hypothetical protein